ncbi:hypothetical protein P3X46_034797 [Hevea brasiliensis]|uniref:Uncharacterized protein n=1 Tax=Hevea brasiliensis TaxID=3981 RepID=A0ABQ9KB58_HEVBR|nr:hypothetical protein P3X46_034797 [Hevea brasiliensis]
MHSCQWILNLGVNMPVKVTFKKVLMKSQFITKDPTIADLFFLPFSIARMCHDPRIGLGGIQDFIRDYIFNIHIGIGLVELTIFMLLVIPLDGPQWRKQRK